MKKFSFIFIFIIVVVPLTMYAKQSAIPHFSWMKDVGAKTFRTSNKTYFVNDFGAIGDAVFICTESIQKAIDQCAANGGGIVTFHPGIYLTGSVFIKSNVNFNIPKGTMLVGSQDIADYTEIPTRVAGIEMSWPAALINITGQENAAITGDGVINGNGKIFWEKYWNMRKEYDPKGLRWIVDYDCKRPRGILISDCKNVTVKDVVLYQPGFWSLHILYSNHVTVDNIIISNNIEGRGPSTDGVDIDSSSKILIQNSNINCNDDNFCLKAGRDADGLRVNRPCEYVVIRNCVAGYGAGLFTCGSETSGGIHDIVVYNMKAVNTACGLRFKSTVQRGGTIENIYLSDIEMVGVHDPLVVDLNWNPAYSTSKLPDGYNPDSIPEHWKKCSKTSI
ncbi:MAG: glycoside hydrolase family 28 protein [Bacteroidales bacterium]|nr:glycoside hydrolase family 28 protein [Bacteroidales bacterium]